MLAIFNSICARSFVTQTLTRHVPGSRWGWNSILPIAAAVSLSLPALAQQQANTGSFCGTFTLQATNTCASAGSNGLWGRSTAATGATYGVYGSDTSTTGRGVFGWATATTNRNYGVYGRTDSNNGMGVLGFATSTDGTNISYGIAGQASSTKGIGAFGVSTSTTGTTYGVYGQTNSSAGIGVQGIATSVTGTNYGVHGKTASPNGRAVFGDATSTDIGSSFGVWGQTSSPIGQGVFGWAKATTGINFGVYGRTDSTEGHGVFGYAANSGAGTGFGVWGQSNSPSGAGVYGFSEDGTGVRAESTNGVSLDVRGLTTFKGVATEGGQIQIFSTGVTTTITMNGLTGDVCGTSFNGAGCDVAETFDMMDPTSVQPGMVMVMNPKKAGHLEISHRAYDRSVAGIVSGAGGINPGVKLGHRIDGTSDLPVALTGRVYCQVDATESAIEIGDMLTTSNTAGHAMKAADRDLAFGAVLGKAMQPLAKGEKGLVLVLVSLQ